MLAPQFRILASIAIDNSPHVRKEANPGVLH
jgi:hypothetical protein